MAFNFRYEARMLGVMRKHAGWGLKVVLVIIIVTFVFFFGFNKFREQSRDAVAIQVGKDEIPFAEYRLFYENQYDQMQQSFKGGEIPDFLKKSVSQSVQQQLVNRALIHQFAESLGMQVTDQELADNIMKEKDFDPVTYKNFINNFYGRYGIPYEGILREDLMVKDFQDWVQRVEPTTENSADRFQWTFEVVTLSGDEKKNLANEIQGLWHQGKEATPLLKQNKLNAEKIGPLSIKDFGRLFNGQLSPEQVATLFGLNTPKSAPAIPLAKDKRFFLARLIEKKTTPSKKEEKPSPAYLPEVRITDIWFRNYANKTKIVSNIKPEEL